MGLGDVDHVGYWIPATGFYDLPDVGVAFDRDDAAAAGCYFLDVRGSLFVLEDRVGVLRSDADDWEACASGRRYRKSELVAKTDAELHLPRRVALAVDHSPARGVIEREGGV